jgi:TP901 family phage tail tape measure protein
MAAHAGTAYVDLKGNFGPLNRELASKVGPMANQFGGRFGKALGPVMAQQQKHLRTFTTGAKYAALGGGALAVVVGRDLVQAGMKFEKQMDTNAAVSEANRKQMALLERQAIRLGKATFFSANEAAEAQSELVKGGLKIKQVLGGGLPAALNLAEAGSLDLAVAAETTVNAMKLFGLEGKEAGSVADMLSTAANKTTADVLDFAMALKQGGSVTKLAGYEMNETVTVLEALAEAGIKNSDAGTSMKAATIQLLKPSKKQLELTKELNLHWITQNGELKSAAGLSKELHRATGDMTKAERAKTLATLAGTDGVRTLNALYAESPAKLKALEVANVRQGTAQEIATKKMDNLAGQVEQFKGSLETAEIQIYKGIAPALAELTEEATQAANRVGAVFENPNLSDGEKVQRAISVLQDELARIWDRNEMSEHLLDALDYSLDTVLPHLAENAGQLGVVAAKGFVHGFTHTDLLGKAVMGVWLLNFIGGKAPFVAIGKSLGRRFGMTFSAEAAAGAATGSVAQKLATAAVSGAPLPARPGTLPALGSGARRQAERINAHGAAFGSAGLFGAAMEVPNIEREMVSRGQVGGKSFWRGWSSDIRGRLPQLRTTGALMGRRLADGLATYGLGGFVAGQMTREIVGGKLGSDVGSAMEMAGVGASIGTAIAPGIGTAIGAVGGIAASEIMNQLTGPSLGEGLAADLNDQLNVTLGPRLAKAVNARDLGKLTGLQHNLRGAIQAAINQGADDASLQPLRDKLNAVKLQIGAVQIPRTMVDEQVEALKSGLVTRMKDINHLFKSNIENINKGWVHGSDGWRRETEWNLRGAVAAIKAGMKAEVIETEAGQKRIKELMRNLRLVEGRDPFGLAEGFAATWKDAGRINNREVDRAINDLKKMPRPFRESAQDAMIQMARGMEAKGVLVKGSAARLQSALLTKFGKTNKQLVSGFSRATSSIAGLFDDLSHTVRTALQGLGVNVNAALKSLGVSQTVDFALDIGGAATKAVGRVVDDVVGRQEGGFIVPGNGSGDKFRTALKPNSFILNREATSSFGFQKGGMTPVALEAGERVFTPSEVKALGANNLEAMNRTVPRFQKGGSLGPEPKLTGPGPLQALGQAAIRQVYDGAKSYIEKHTPHGGAGYSGPAIGPKGTSVYKGILMATWVREALEYGAGHGSGDPQPTSGYRSHAENVAAGRNYFSEHEKTQYPGGAVDFGSYTTGLAEKMAVVNATRSFKYPLLAPVGFEDDGHASGTGHQLGGIVSAIQRLAKGGFIDASQTQENVALAIGRRLLGYGLNYKGAAGVIGNAWRESLWKPGSIGTGGRGLWGFDYYEAELLAAAEQQDVPWTDLPFQTDFMWSGPEPASKLKGALNAQGSAASAAEFFDTEWEKSGVKAMSDRKNGAREAMRLMTGSDMEGAGSDEHTYKEDVPSVYEGAKTGDLSFPSVPKNLAAIDRELKRWEGEARAYRRAKKKAEKKNRPGVAQAIGTNLTEIENHLRKLRSARTKLRTEAAKRKVTRSLAAKIGQFGDYEVHIDGLARDFTEANQDVEQLVALEPQSPELPATATDGEREAAEKRYVADFTAYVEQREKPEYEGLLGKVADWRNAILRAEYFGWPASTEQGGAVKAGKRGLGGAVAFDGKPGVADVQTRWEKKVRGIDNEIDFTERLSDEVAKQIREYKQDHPKAKPDDYPGWLKKRIAKRDHLREKLPFLRFEDRETRKAIGEARGFFFPGGKNRLKPPGLPLAGTGSLEDKLIEVQGIHWPDQHGLLPAAALAPPRKPGVGGGVLWDLQTSMEDLGIKVRQAGNSIGGGGESGEGEQEAVLRELLTQSNQEKIIRQIEQRVFGGRDDFAPRFRLGGLLGDLPPYAGKAHTGAIVPGPRNAERTMIVKSGEGIFTPEQMGALGGLGVAGDTNVSVVVYEDDTADVTVNDQKIEAVVERVQRRQARGARPRAGSQGRRIG